MQRTDLGVLLDQEDLNTAFNGDPCGGRPNRATDDEVITEHGSMVRPAEGESK